MMSAISFWQNTCISEAFVTVYSKRNAIQGVSFTNTRVWYKPREPPTRLNMGWTAFRHSPCAPPHFWNCIKCFLFSTRDWKQATSLYVPSYLNIWIKRSKKACGRLLWVFNICDQITSPYVSNLNFLATFWPPWQHEDYENVFLRKKDPSY